MTQLNKKVIVVIGLVAFFLFLTAMLFVYGQDLKTWWRGRY